MNQMTYRILPGWSLSRRFFRGTCRISFAGPSLLVVLAALLSSCMAGGDRRESPDWRTVLRVEGAAVPEGSGALRKMAAPMRSSESHVSGNGGTGGEGRGPEPAIDSGGAYDACRGPSAGTGSSMDPPVILDGKSYTSIDGMKMIWLSPGSFVMGHAAPDGRNPPPVNAAWPVRTVVVRKGFWISASEITQGCFEKVLGYNPSRFKRTDGPVESVTWRQARSFCRILTERAMVARGLSTLSEFGYRYDLPSEAQWEYACRAGTTGPYYGPVLADLAWFAANSGGHPHVVCRKKANPWGLFDMLGNVEEWCLDSFFQDYRGAPGDERPRIAGLPWKAVRGGSWRSRYGRECSSYARHGGGPCYAFPYIGFRVVLVRNE